MSNTFGKVADQTQTTGGSYRGSDWGSGSGSSCDNVDHRNNYDVEDREMCCLLQVIKSLNPHKDFRLWMTAEVHPKFPTILLQSSLKITFEVCQTALQRFCHLTFLANLHL